METENRSDKGTTNGKSRTYFTLGVVFLLAMAFFWSVDTSLVYIFVGIACFFLFLGFYSRPRPNIPKQDYNRTFTRQKPEPEIRTSAAEGLKDIFQKFGKEFAKRGESGPISAGKIIRFVTIGIFLMFLFPMIVSIFNGGNESGADYYTSAEQYYATQQYDSAYVNYRRAMQLDPENTGVMLGYGNVLAVRNEKDSAIMMFNRVLEISPEYKEASYGKALALFDEKKYSDGIATLQPVIESNPEYYDAKLLMGDCYYTQKKYDDAITWYEDAYQNGGVRSRILCHVMAYIYDTKGDFERAISLYQEALSYDSSIVDIYQRLGELIPGEQGNFYRTKVVQMQQ